jgi:coenzyme PQQ synthesis protein D (PqqD)
MPLARKDGLIVDSIGDELLVYDVASSRAHSLNAVAADVWRACDGDRDLGQLAEFTGLDRSAVELALNNLQEVGLISRYEPSGVSRRVVLRRLSLTAAGLAVGLPVIRSITAPTAAMAYAISCPNSGQCPHPDGSFCGSNGKCVSSGGNRPVLPTGSCYVSASSCRSDSFCRYSHTSSSKFGGVFSKGECVTGRPN